MNKSEILATLCAGLVMALLSACPAFAYKGEKLAPHAKIGLSNARAIALKADPGAITDEELEREAGGTGLRYSFDIKEAGTLSARRASTPRPAAYSRTPLKGRTPIRRSQTV